MLTFTTSSTKMSMSSLTLLRAQRTYATVPPSTKPQELAQAASAASKIQERRSELTTSFARTPLPSRSLTLSEKRSIVQPPISAHQASTTFRSRIRGVKKVRLSDGSYTDRVVGQKIFLPNVLFTLVKNHTPPGKAYNPYEATFRITQNLTKTDIRSYLHAVYGVACTYIRTDNRLVSEKHRKNIATGRLEDLGQKRNYKRAVVGLKDPFYYPQMTEDMNGKQRWLREATVEELFRVKVTKDIQQAISVKFVEKAKSNDVDVLKERWNTRKTILRKLWERKEERDRITKEFAKKLEATREEEA